ncbi:MAG TPA: tetratricopeptide repeat protein, partial [Vicinamibacterales bacterium]|nr:tetratricopeptide repeat protein [Vicinamibacterales bacterium]
MRISSVVLAAGLVGVGFGLTLHAAAAPADCAALLRHGRRGEAKACYTALVSSADPYLRAEGFWGVEQYEDANKEFRTAVAQSDRPGNNATNAHDRVRWGRLMHERFNDKVAGDLFHEALERDPKNADAYVGLGIVSAELFNKKAREYLDKALELNPKLFEAREVLADLALDDSDYAEASKQADAALQISSDALDAIAAHAAMELLADRSPDEWIGKMLQINSTYGKGYALIAAQLVIHMRYEEGVAYYRKAVEVDPRLWSARSQLAIQLMRLGQEEEPRQQLLLSFNNGFRDAATANSLKLLDSYKNFETFKDKTTILRLYKNEAPLLRPYFDDILKRALATYQKKYNMTLPDPVQVEVYPNHDDFAVRTLGLPGLGASGVTFGEVVAMDSPSGQKPGSFNWASTLWHELDHVFILTETKHRVPRWFAEGLAVHEEKQANPRWAYQLTPEIVVAM